MCCTMYVNSEKRVVFNYLGQDSQEFILAAAEKRVAAAFDKARQRFPLENV